MGRKTAKTLSSYEFMEQFSTEKKAIKFFENIRWKKGVYCPECSSERIAKRKFPYYRCKDCREIFTVRTGTIFHRSKIHLKKWLYTIYLLQTARKGISSLQLSKEIGVTQKTAWFMLHRIREACTAKGLKLSGEVQVDETYFGGKNINRHKNKIVKNWQKDKVMVQGIMSDKTVKTHIINSPTKKKFIGNIMKNVDTGSHIMTDENQSYKGLDRYYKHSTVHHGNNEYFIDGITTNGLESVWAVMKRGYKGVYHHWSKKHLHRYLNEFTFRLDKGNVSINTMDRVHSLLEGSVDRRLTYQRLVN